MQLVSQIAGRNLILALMLLLTLAASLVSFSYDADTQDDIPPVTVELKFLPQSPAVTQNVARAPLAVTSATSAGPVFNSLAVSVPIAAHLVPHFSLHLSPTLRC